MTTNPVLELADAIESGEEYYNRHDVEPHQLFYQFVNKDARNSIKVCAVSAAYGKKKKLSAEQLFEVIDGNKGRTEEFMASEFGVNNIVVRGSSPDEEDYLISWVVNELSDRRKLRPHDIAKEIRDVVAENLYEYSVEIAESD